MGAARSCRTAHKTLQPPALHRCSCGVATEQPSCAVCTPPYPSTEGRTCRKSYAHVGIEVEGGAAEARSPLVHVRLAGQPEEATEAQALLQRVADAALKRDGVLLVVSRTSPLDTARVAPSLRRAHSLMPLP